MVIYMLLAGASYALAALLAQALGPRRPEYPADEPARRSIRAR